MVDVCVLTCDGECFHTSLSSAWCNFIHSPSVCQGQKSHISKSEIHVFFKLSANLSIVFENIQVFKISIEAGQAMLAI